MTFQLREAGRGDAEALLALATRTYTEAFGHSLSSADLAAHLERHLSPGRIRDLLRDEVFLLALEKGVMVGFVQFGDADTNDAELVGVQPGDKELRRLYVAAEVQGRGVGTRLLQTALADPRLEAATRVYLDVWEENHGARRLYERFGFERVGERALVVASGAATGVDFVMARIDRETRRNP